MSEPEVEPGYCPAVYDDGTRTERCALIYHWDDKRMAPIGKHVNADASWFWDDADTRP